MQKSVLDIGNCSPDHHSICRMLERSFEVVVHRADQLSDALETLKKVRPDLVLVNRKLDIDYSDGMEVIRHFRSTEELQSIPIMLVTNYPDHQQQAVAMGALYGFGKLELSSPETLKKLEIPLGPSKLVGGPRNWHSGPSNIPASN